MWKIRSLISVSRKKFLERRESDKLHFMQTWVSGSKRDSVLEAGRAIQFYRVGMFGKSSSFLSVSSAVPDVGFLSSRCGVIRNFSERCDEGTKKPFKHVINAFLSPTEEESVSGGAGITWMMPCVSMLWISTVLLGKSVVTYG